MKKKPYTPNHMGQRVDIIKQIWVKEALLKERKNYNLNRAIGSSIAFTVGFITAIKEPQVWALALSLITYIIFYFLWDYALTAWGILQKN